MSINTRFIVVAVLSFGVLTACAGEGTYPISGMPVSENDPVKDMNFTSRMLYGSEPL